MGQDVPLNVLSQRRSMLFLLATVVLLVGVGLLFVSLSYLVSCLRESIQKRRIERKEAEERERVEKVRTESKRVAALESLYNQYISKFHLGISPMVFIINCSSKAQAMNTTGKKLWLKIVDYAYDHREEIGRRIRLAQDNSMVQLSYIREIAGLPDYAFIGQLRTLEDSICNQYYLSPECELRLIVRVEYISPAGRSSYFNQYSIGQSSLLSAIEQGKRAEVEVDRRRQERAKMNPKLRYRVLERDHFRCVRCGASAADGAKLHVDHIVPVSRGGKTVMSNLQTLCEACNLGKGADMPK